MSFIRISSHSLLSILLVHPYLDRRNSFDCLVLLLFRSGTFLLFFPSQEFVEAFVNDDLIQAVKRVVFFQIQKSPLLLQILNKTQINYPSLYKPFSHI